MVKLAIFEDGFETNDFSKWSSTETGDGGAIITQDIVKHHGTYAAKLSTPVTASSYAFCQKTPLAVTSPFFMRSYIRWATTPDLNEKYTIAHDMVTSGNMHYFCRFMRTGANTGQWYFYMGGTEWGPSDPVNWAIDTWYCLETNFVASATVGELRLYWNSVEVLTITDLNTGTNGINRIRLEAYNFPDTLAAQEIYFDCVVADGSRIYCEAEAKILRRLLVGVGL